MAPKSHHSWIVHSFPPRRRRPPLDIEFCIIVSTIQKCIDGTEYPWGWGIQSSFEVANLLRDICTRALLHGDLARSSRSPLLVKVMTPWRCQTKKSPIGPNVHANWSWAQRTLPAYRGRDSTDGLEWSTLRYGRSKVSLVVPCTKIDLMCPKSDNMIDPGALGFLLLHNRYTRDQWQRSHKSSWLLATIFSCCDFLLVHKTFNNACKMVGMDSRFGFRAPILWLSSASNLGHWEHSYPPKRGEGEKTKTNRNRIFSVEKWNKLRFPILWSIRFSYKTWWTLRFFLMFSTYYILYVLPCRPCWHTIPDPCYISPLKVYLDVSVGVIHW